MAIWEANRWLVGFPIHLNTAWPATGPIDAFRQHASTITLPIRRGTERSSGILLRSKPCSWRTELKYELVCIVPSAAQRGASHDLIPAWTVGRGKTKPSDPGTEPDLHAR